MKTDKIIMKKLGIDIGQVLIAPDAADGRADTSIIGGSLPTALATPPHEGMLDAVPDPVTMFNGQVWLVSKAGPRVHFNEGNPQHGRPSAGGCFR